MSKICFLLILLAPITALAQFTNLKWAKDCDRDGYWAAAFFASPLCPIKLVQADQIRDCDDNSRFVYPDAPEILDGKFNDCRWVNDPAAFADFDPAFCSLVHLSTVLEGNVRVAAPIIRDCWDDYPVRNLPPGSPSDFAFAVYKPTICEDQGECQPWNQLPGYAWFNNGQEEFLMQELHQCSFTDNDGKRIVFFANSSDGGYNAYVRGINPPAWAHNVACRIIGYTPSYHPADTKLKDRLNRWDMRQGVELNQWQPRQVGIEVHRRAARSPGDPTQPYGSDPTSVAHWNYLNINHTQNNTRWVTVGMPDLPIPR